MQSDLLRCGRTLFLIAVAGVVAACGSTTSDRGDALFTRLPADSTGITFANNVTEGPEHNVFTYTNFYNGGGVSAGDLTGNGRPDLYFTSNQKSNKLYLNEGDFRFRDVTQQAGVSDRSGWTTGVTMADVNGDGRLDIYVCKSGWMTAENRRNKLYVNQGPGADGVPHFAERAAAFGLDDSGHATHASFFDYDGDGDLDLFLLNHATGRTRVDLDFEDRRANRDPTAGDKLYRNDGGTFVDVSDEAGILGAATGYGLSVTVSDIDRDGWPDIYVANDFVEDDRLYMNQADGTFEEEVRSWMDHISYSSMGADIADYTNNGLPDVYTLDMLAEDNLRQKLLVGPEGFTSTRTMRSRGYYHQYQRNMLHRNNGDGSFSEIGQLAGVSNTDWSWAGLFADFNLDGFKDLYVTNGFRRDYTNLDFHHSVLYSNPNYLQFYKEQDARGVDLFGLLEQMPSTPIPNYAFHNRGDLTFEKVSSEWGLAQKGFSSGAAYADLNNDGALDLVVNNIDEEALVYRNNARRQTDNHFLTVVLEGVNDNRWGVGTKVEVSTPKGRTFYQELIPARGFQSSVEPTLHFGLGTADTVSVKVIWPDQTQERRTGVAADQTLTLHQADAGSSDSSSPPVIEPYASEVTKERGLAFTHRENSFDDFDLEPLLPHMHSRLGPALASADVNGNGRTDLFVGGARGQASVLFLQQKDGSFERASLSVFTRHRPYEDVDAAFVDVDDDGDEDLYVVSGGMVVHSGDDFQDRVYLNDGSGAFTYAPDVLPTIKSSGGTVAVHDYNEDGQPDLFVGGRIAPNAYPTAPRSYLLRNDGGRFVDVTADVAPSLVEPGMVTDALWHDVDHDETDELVVVGEWMPIRIFRPGPAAAFEEMTEQMGFAETNGWWYALAAADFTGDGGRDLVVGNRGLNAQVQAGRGEPAALYAADFSRDGSIDPLMTHYLHGKEYPVYWHDTLVEAIPPFEQRFESYEDYATSTISDILTPEERDRVERYTVSTFETSLFENDGEGRFRARSLPNEVQVAPIHDLLVHDVNADDRPDLMLAGNDFSVRPQWGRADAEKGTILLNQEASEFRAVSHRKSGFSAPEDVRSLVLLHTADGPLVVVGNNDAALSAFELRQSSEPVAGQASRQEDVSARR